MGTPELTAYRIAAGALAVLTYLAWGFSGTDESQSIRNLFFVSMVVTLLVAAACNIKAYRSPARWLVGGLYAITILTAVPALFDDFRKFGFEGILGLGVVQIGLLAWLARAAFVAEVTADV